MKKLLFLCLFYSLVPLFVVQNKAKKQVKNSTYQKCYTTCQGHTFLFYSHIYYHIYKLIVLSRCIILTSILHPSSSYKMNIKKNNVFIYPLDNKVIFPYHEYAFSISSNVYEPETFDNLIGFATRLEDSSTKKYLEQGIQSIDGISSYGVLLKIHKSEISGYKVSEKMKIYKFNFFGLTFARFRISTLKKVDGNLIASIEIFPDNISKESQTQIEKKHLFDRLKKQMKIYYECKLKHHEAQIKKQIIEQQKSSNKLIYKCSSQLEITVAQKLKLLQISRQDIKMEMILNQLLQKTQKIKSVLDLQQKVRQDMIKSTASRKQTAMRTLNGRGGDYDELQQKIKAKKLPQHVREQINKQMKRLGGETQAAVALKYIQTLLDIPWLEQTEQIKNIQAAEKVLNQDHTGLKEVKERILQFLAVRFRNGNTKGNIICLHGPPGVGKTSIAKSIAKALGKQFTRVSLGGMNDEAQLRGHRRTYVAAMPGVIVRALIKAKSNNPVILLDEIQKMGTSYKGNPEHALLEILDPSQNSSFKDHYVGIPVDLSKVMFICTANSLDLSTPLLNRLQLIEIPGYTREEKLQILQNHLLPKQLKQGGVQDLAKFENEALVEIVKYSNQMGVRVLQRNIAKICRKVARKNEVQTVNIEKVKQILGPIVKPTIWKGVGVVNGMAWTAIGGKILLVEAIKSPNPKFKLQVTGQLGEVMKESIYIGLSWIKANRSDFALWGGDSVGQQIDQLDRISLHLHFPQGGIKKDGPSAGVTIVTCLVSLLMKVPVRDNLSMTGQITLSGKVLPVGGIRQKCIAAVYEGMKHIIVPFQNMKDLEKIPDEIKNKATFYPVKSIREVLGIAFPTILDKIPSNL